MNAVGERIAAFTDPPRDLEITDRRRAGVKVTILADIVQVIEYVWGARALRREQCQGRGVG